MKSLTLGAAALLLVAVAMPAQGQQLLLKVHHFLPSTSNAQVNLIQPWCDKINRESNDRLKCQIYPAMQLGGTPPQLFDQARDGVADIVWTVPTYSAGRFSKSEVFELPALGAAPVQMPLPQVPEALSKGVIDGAMVPWEGVPAIKLQEIAKYHLHVPAGAPRFSNTIFAFTMNQAKYDALAPELKKVIDANSGLAVSGAAGEKTFDAVVEPHRKLAQDRGNVISYLSSAEMQRWVKASEGVEGDWVKEVSAKGADGKKLLDEARALIKQYEE